MRMNKGKQTDTRAECVILKERWAKLACMRRAEWRDSTKRMATTTATITDLYYLTKKL